jgi:hypothetical protein
MYYRLYTVPLQTGQIWGLCIIEDVLETRKRCNLFITDGLFILKFEFEISAINKSKVPLSKRLKFRYLQV